MLNSIGLQNPGSRVVIDEILPSLDFTETRFFANLSGFTVEEYSACVSTKGADYARGHDLDCLSRLVGTLEPDSKRG